MTRTHTATVEIRRWKSHDCIGCGCRYAYSMARKLAYGGSTPERAEEKAQAAAERAMTREVDRQPCPNCGLYQPDMVAGRRRLLHGLVLFVTLLGFAPIATLVPAQVVQVDRALTIAAAAAALLGVFGFLIDWQNPNRHLPRNLAKAQQELAAGRMRVLQPGTPLPRGFQVRSMRRHGALACGLLIAALAALMAPDGFRRHAGWPLNTNAWPPVVGPGDSVRIYLPEWVTSINGYWKGLSLVTAGKIEIPSTTEQTDWGSTIRFRKDDRKDDRATRQQLWVRLQVPSESSLENSALPCDVVMKVEYPAVESDAIFATQRLLVRQRVTLGLGSLRAGRRYQIWCWSGMVAGLCLLVASMIVRLRGTALLARAANPGALLDEPDDRPCPTAIDVAEEQVHPT